MRLSDTCAECLYDKQQHLTDDEEYLRTVRDMLDSRSDDMTAPYMVYLFALAYEKRFGKGAPYAAVKRSFNDLVLSVEDTVRERIETSDDPVTTALLYSRIGNYIDFGAMNNVSEVAFLSLLDSVRLNERDREVVASFKEQCRNAGNFLLISDNCGEIVLDRLLLEQLHKSFPSLGMTVLVRGKEVLNDVTEEDARYAGIDCYAKIVSNGMPLAGTVYALMPPDAKAALDEADVILAKGQGNYESLTGEGRHVFFSFLCKCDLFTDRFNVPKLAGIFIEEK